MKLKITKNILRGDLAFDEGQIYEVEEIIIDSYKIKVPMKQKGKFRYV